LQDKNIPFTIALLKDKALWQRDEKAYRTIS
jgi:hypothetical protein